MEKLFLYLFFYCSVRDLYAQWVTFFASFSNRKKKNMVNSALYPIHCVHHIQLLLRYKRWHFFSLSSLFQRTQLLLHLNFKFFSSLKKLKQWKVEMCAFQTLLKIYLPVIYTDKWICYHFFPYNDVAFICWQRSRWYSSSL